MFMMEYFGPQDQVEADLRVYPSVFGPRPSYFQDEASARLQNGENGLDIIGYPQ